MRTAHPDMVMITGANASTRASIRVNGRSAWKLSRPGRQIHHSSVVPGRPAVHERYTELPPPAYGKQNRRRRACGLGLRQKNQGLDGLISVINAATSALSVDCHEPPSLAKPRVYNLSRAPSRTPMLSEAIVRTLDTRTGGRYPRPTPGRLVLRGWCCARSPSGRGRKARAPMSCLKRRTRVRGWLGRGQNAERRRDNDRTL
jgi:hypothetical protein